MPIRLASYFLPRAWHLLTCSRTIEAANIQDSGALMLQMWQGQCLWQASLAERAPQHTAFHHIDHFKNGTDPVRDISFAIRRIHRASETSASPFIPSITL